MCTGYIGLRILNGQVCKDVKWIHVAQNNAHPWVVANTFPKINLRFDQIRDC